MTGQDETIREEILQAAVGLYRKYGPSKITLDNLAKTTMRSRSSLYYYFKDRDEIFQAVLERIARDVASEIGIAVKGAVTLSEKINSFCATKIKTTQEWKLVFNSIDLQADNKERNRHAKFLDALHTKLIYLERLILVDAITSVLTVANKAYDPAEVDLMIFIISGSVRGIRREVYDHNDPHNAGDAVKLFSRMAAKWLQ